LPATADAEGRIRCKQCRRTLLWVKEGIVHWTFHTGAGRRRVFGIPANSPALFDLLVVCECGTRWTPVLTCGQPLPAPPVAGVLKPVAAGTAA